MRRPFPLAVPLGIALLASCSDTAPPLSPSGSRASLADADFDLTLQEVALRPGVAVDLHARVYVNEGSNAPACPAGKTALALHGFAHTAATWEPFAEALFAERPQEICRVIALDLPGHGGSGDPDGLPFGLLTLEDYAAALTGALAELEAQGRAPGTLIGHSQGGIVVQMAQQALVEGGSSLREAFDVGEVVLLAPTLPRELPWGAADSGFLVGLLSGFAVPDLASPTHFAVPDAVWPLLFFSDLAGVPAAAAPTAAEVATLGYNAPEPVLSALQLVGALGLARPSVDAGIFAGERGSRLTIVAFEQDAFVRPEEDAALFDHLTGGRNGWKFHVVAGEGAVHDMYVSDPAGLLAGAGAGLP